MAAQLPQVAPAGQQAHLEANFITVLTNVIGLSQPQINIMVRTEGNTLVTYLNQFRENELLDMFPERGANKLTARSKVHLICLRNWLKKKLSLVENEDDIDPIEFDVQTCREMTDRRADDDDDDPNESNTGLKLGVFNGKADEWDDKIDEFVTYLGLQRNKKNIPLRYIIRDDTERPPEPLTSIEQDIYDAPLRGNAFENDNYTVFQYLKKWTIGGTAKTHIDKFERTNDG
jgi:hypothetical protein